MKDGWIVKKLGEVTTFCNGYTPKEVDLMNYGEIPYFKVSDMNHVLNSKYLNYTTLYLNKGCKTYPKNTIVFPKNGAAIATNKKRLLAQESVVDLNTGGVYLNTDELLYEYLYLYFLNIDFKFYTRRGTVPTLDITELKGLNIPIPPLSEQSRIVEELDQLSNIIEKKRQQLSELDNLAQSIFYDMFGDPVVNDKGWEVKKLGEVCDVRDGTHDSPKYLEHSDYVLITSKNIINGDIDYTSINYISEEDYNNINKRSFVEDGDIIMAMIGTIGKPIIVKRKGVKFCIKNVALIKFRDSKEVINTYIQSLLDNSSYMQYINKQNKGGTQKFISLGAIRKFDVPLPFLPLQQLFAQKIEAIESEKALIKQSIAETEELFNSRMDFYFG